MNKRGEFGLTNLEINVHISTFYLRLMVHTFVDIKDQFKTKKTKILQRLNLKDSGNIKSVLQSQGLI